MNEHLKSFDVVDLHPQAVEPVSRVWAEDAAAAALEIVEGWEKDHVQVHQLDDVTYAIVVTDDDWPVDDALILKVYPV